VFEVSGVIQQSAYLTISNPYCWIAGCTAPSPGITLRQTTLRPQAAEIFIEHIRFIAGDEGTSPPKDSRDCITLNGASSVYIKNCSFFWSVDELMGCGPSSACSTVTFDRCLFAEPLRDGGHSEGAHDYGLLFNTNNQRNITFNRCVAAHMQERFIRARGVTIEKINCVGYNMTGSAGWNNLTPDATVSQQLFDLIGCYYKQPVTALNSREALQASGGPNTSDSRYYVAGVICPTRPTDTGSEWLAVKTGATASQIN